MTITNERILKSLNQLNQTQSLQLAPDLNVGGEQVIMMAGPCSVESYEQTHAVGAAIYQMGGRVLRGGAFKPRTSPHAFQGLGTKGLEILRSVADEFGLLVITEALGVEHLPEVMEYADIIQIGSRNMQHFPLLWAVGETDKPVLLKRGFMSTIDEWLLAAEHISTRGNHNIMLCERGIRGFDDTTRNVFDTTAIALVKQRSPFPVIADPSHATGQTDLVLPAARAAVAAGADGLLVEFHPNPIEALSDAEQAVPLSEMQDFYSEVDRIAAAMGRSLT
ncbi:MAG: 3-deoxy-7-phosphoheptulonate synthase [Chloroflexi bacterium]|nr:MAG: 3-deoxy-7-phosphoheptulonate synthase [Chloroflexota bacterium]MBL1193448.1 3-deoxy-7-phosphoheptulonate synthase [Chloroflexota bacterium]NOH10739.1 3-deoxy-7-phosphoheptulonate synthase [Chloroflexota bacterium]